MGIKSPRGDGDGKKVSPTSVDGDGDGVLTPDREFPVAIFTSKTVSNKETQTQNG